jgi:hypothetical protein
MHAVWADNNFVKTLSNFHSPTIVAGGMKRRVRDPVTKKDQENKLILIVLHNRLTTARPTIRLIRGTVPSHLHGWGPKLAARYFNMNLNNAYKVYCWIYYWIHPTSRPMPLKNASIICPTVFFKEEIQCDREVMVPLHVLQRILELLIELLARHLPKAGTQSVTRMAWSGWISARCSKYIKEAYGRWKIIIIIIFLAHLFGAR